MKNKVNMSCVYNSLTDTLSYLTHDMTPTVLNGGLIWDSGTALQNFPDGQNQDFYCERAYLWRGMLFSSVIVELTGVLIEDGDMVAIDEYDVHGDRLVSESLISWLEDLKVLSAQPISVSANKQGNQIVADVVLNDRFSEEIKALLATKNDEELSPYTERHIAQQGVEGTMHYLHGAITDKLFTYFDTSEKVQLEGAIEDLKDLMKLHDMNEAEEESV